uniref:Uncharacterized protein n=1 Tax=Anguilla anguilla TaxID=7936 RepID=A0A0E9VPY0_ANGAN
MAGLFLSANAAVAIKDV